MITTCLALDYIDLTMGCYSPPPLKNLGLRFRTKGVTKEGIHASLRREKLWIL
jgi:hypothetical protein